MAGKRLGSAQQGPRYVHGCTDCYASHQRLITIALPYLTILIPSDTSRTTKLYLHPTHAAHHPIGVRLVHLRHLPVSITLVPRTVVVDMAHLSRSGCPRPALTTTMVYATSKIQSQLIHEDRNQKDDRQLQLQPFPSIALIHIRLVVDMAHRDKDKYFHTLPIHSLQVAACMLMYRRLSLYKQVAVAITQRKGQKIATITTSFRSIRAPLSTANLT